MSTYSALEGSKARYKVGFKCEENPPLQNGEQVRLEQNLKLPQSRRIHSSDKTKDKVYY